MNWHVVFIIALCVFAISMFYLSNKIKKFLEYKKIRISSFVTIIISILLIISGFIFRPALIILFYCVMLFIIVDLIRLIYFIINKFYRKNLLSSKKYKKFLVIINKIYHGGLLIFILVLLLFVYSVYNAKNIVTTNYSINVSKDFSDKKIVFISDLHLGSSISDSEGLTYLVNRINSMNPDFIILGGDIYDETTPKSLREQSFQAFKDFNSTYGTIYISGNHDRLTDDLRKSLINSNIIVLEDDYILNDSIYVVGRRYDRNNNRENLSNLLNDLDKNNVILLLDHEPIDLVEAERLGVDLQLSGHTHGGQLYPIKYVVKMIYGIIYGHNSSNGYNIIVSSGIGAWGFNARIGTHSEIVSISLNSK